MTKNTLIITLVALLLSGCGIYSFTGASIPSDAKTVSVENFTITATNSPASLKQIITEGLKDLFLSQTSLNLTASAGDLRFSGSIAKYEVNPMAIQANETAGKNRLTISIKVKYSNTLDQEKNFESTFSRYSDFNSSENLSDVETVLIEEISKELLEDIFNKAFVNW